MERIAASRYARASAESSVNCRDGPVSHSTRGRGHSDSSRGQKPVNIRRQTPPPRRHQLPTAQPTVTGGDTSSAASRPTHDDSGDGFGRDLSMSTVRQWPLAVTSSVVDLAAVSDTDTILCNRVNGLLVGVTGTLLPLPVRVASPQLTSTFTAPGTQSTLLGPADAAQAANPIFRSSISVSTSGTLG